MEKSREFTGRTVEEAIELGLKEMEVDREKVEVVVLGKGRSGILGLGSEPAKVRIALLSEKQEADPVPLAREILEGLLQRIGADVAIHPKEFLDVTGTSSTGFDIRGDDSGLLIGRRGEILYVLQYLLNFMVSRRLKAKAAVPVDVDSYREKRTESLKALAFRLAEKVKTSGKPITLEPMPAVERRIIHQTLSEDPDIETRSFGNGGTRKIIISFKGLE